LEIFVDPLVVYIPRCIQNGSESVGLKAMENFNVGIGGCPPWLNAIGPDGFEYCFI
jgi:hypothetical protein